MKFHQLFHHLTRGHSVCDKRSDFLSNQRNLIDKLIYNLKSRFPDGEVVSAFSILDPQNLPSLVDLPLYGSTEIDTLASQYGESKENNGMKLEPVIDGEMLREEWVFSSK